MRSAALALVLVPLMAPATFAQQTTAETENVRSFVLFNRAGQAVEEAHVTTSQGRQRKITSFGAIRSEQSQEFRLPNKACVDSVTVKLHDGRTLAANHLNDCRSPRLVVTDNAIRATTAAVPGAHPR